MNQLRTDMFSFVDVQYRSCCILQVFIWSTWATQRIKDILRQNIWNYCREGELFHIPSYSMKFLLVQENHCKTKGYIRDNNFFLIITKPEFWAAAEEEWRSAGHPTVLSTILMSQQTKCSKTVPSHCLSSVHRMYKINGQLSDSSTKAFVSGNKPVFYQHELLISSLLILFI